VAHLAVIILSALWLPGAGCGLFETRQPQTGDETAGNWVPPTQAEIAVENLQRAFEGGVISDYQRSLTDDFIFTPDDSDVATFQQERPGEDVYGDWTTQVEVQTAEAIRTGASELSLTLTFLTEELVPTGRLRKYQYVLLVTEAGTTTDYRGEAWFTISQITGGDWAISAWEDVASDPQIQSWGYLKGANRVL
jgi:hypothetical protein